MRRFPFKTVSGSIVLPVTVDGEFFTEPEIYKYGNLCELYFEFFEDEDCNIPVTPTGGNIFSLASPMGNLFLPAASNYETQAQKVSYPQGSYFPPMIDGLVDIAKIEASGITGANYMKAILFTHNS